MPVASVQRVVASLLALAELPAARLGAARVMNLPSLSVTPGQIERAVQRHGARGRITWQPDARLQAIVDGWPRAFTSAQALQLGLQADPDVDTLVSSHLHSRP